MRPKERRESGQTNLLRSRLDAIIDIGHPLVKLSRTIDWSFLEQRFGAIYEDKPGRPPLPTRLMAGLAILKQTYDLSDEVLCERWLENPYYQFFCGEEFFQHRLVFDRSSLSRWRQRMGEEKLQALLQESLSVATRTEAIKPSDLNRVIIDTTQHQRGPKVYSLHAPEVECIGKGKAHRPYEFGVKVSVATTLAHAKGGQFVTHVKALPGNPYDRHILKTVIPDMEALVGNVIERMLLDKRYRGHNAPPEYKFRVFISGQKRRVTLQIKRELRRRSAVEPVIGHLKSEHRMGRNYLWHREGDATNAVLAAVGYNFRRLIKWLRLPRFEILARLGLELHLIPA